MDEIRQALKNKRADILFYGYSDNTTLYYLNRDHTNKIIDDNLGKDQGIIFKSFTEAAKQLKKDKLDGVMVYMHNDGPYLVITHLSDLLYDMWVDDDEECRGKVWHCC